MPGIQLEIDGRIARLTLNRPSVFNALTPSILDALISHCEELKNNATVQVVVLAGAGQNFSAGADLPQFAASLKAAPHETADLGRLTVEALAALPQISIAAIRGYCIGGGVVLSGACDLRIAADDSQFSIPEVDAGIPLSWGGMADVVRLFGHAIANDLVLTCRPFDAEEALRTGFISRSLPARQFDQEVGALAEQIAEKPALVLRQTKQKLQRIRAGRFDARDDAAQMLEALNDADGAKQFGEYLRRTIDR